MSTSGDVISILSDTEDESNMISNLPQKIPIPDEIVPDSEGELEPLFPISRTPPRPRQQQENRQQNDAHSSSVSPVHKRKKKSKLNDDAQFEPKAKKMRTVKAVVSSQEDSNGSNTNNQESQSSSQPRSLTSKARPKPKPKPKPKAKQKLQIEVIETAACEPSRPVSEPQSPTQPQILRKSPPHQEQPSHLQVEPRSPKVKSVKPPTRNPKLKGKKRHEKENPPSPPKDISNPPQTPALTPTSRTDTTTFRTNKNKDKDKDKDKKNRPLTDILRELNRTGTPRFSPAVSRNFLTRIAPLHPNRREPPPPPPRIIPKKTKKEIQMEERWEEELQDSIPNWCELTEEERARFRKQKRDWELRLYED